MIVAVVLVLVLAGVVGAFVAGHHEGGRDGERGGERGAMRGGGDYGGMGHKGWGGGGFGGDQAGGDRAGGGALGGPAPVREVLRRALKDHLKVTDASLKTALKAAVDDLVKDGTLSKDQATQLKARIDSSGDLLAKPTQTASFGLGLG